MLFGESALSRHPDWKSFDLKLELDRKRMLIEFAKSGQDHEVN